MPLYSSIQGAGVGCNLSPTPCLLGFLTIGSSYANCTSCVMEIVRRLGTISYGLSHHRSAREMHSLVSFVLLACLLRLLKYTSVVVFVNNYPQDSEAQASMPQQRSSIPVVQRQRVREVGHACGAFHLTNWFLSLAFASSSAANSAVWLNRLVSTL